ncbi:V/A-type H+-transporting ATPase subunit B [Desulfurobacterium pacificum]|uniref:V/A-type H+-transporting ATPase subunit B n=1 Tax=Desulfurobacterium pacificum TaxID=240166 RepID=A0ABY1NE48_9BACT|nr:V-type ATP synthase subunit B [Desulfurobacterium pacificum]SMP07462.1 V/A-type H+-transporting ATPase subunit B [Desulfurobacterium pacificum]
MKEYYKGVESLKEQLLFFKSDAVEPMFGEKVFVKWKDREVPGRIIEINEKVALIEVLGDSSEISRDVLVRFTGEMFTVSVSEEMVGKRFNAYGEELTTGKKPIGKEVEVYGKPINPFFRDFPKEPIVTGFSAIDGLNVLVKGQKLPIFSVSGVETEDLVISLVNQIQTEETLTVLGVIGLKNEIVDYLIKRIVGNTIVFVARASDPPAAQVLLPRTALTVAEFFAFEKGLDVVTVLFDMTNYCDSLRQISSKREEIPGRKGYPAYMYSDLASIYERAGLIKGKKGSLTMIPVLTMPDDDITHPIPDLTGYITEGQIVLDRKLYQQGIKPPIDVLPSLSRLMNDAIEPFHRRFASQLYSAYAKFKTVEKLASIIGESELGEVERKYLEFGRRFLKEFIGQEEGEKRTLEDTFAVGLRVLSLLPEKELTQLKEEDLKRLGR